MGMGEGGGGEKGGWGVTYVHGAAWWDAAPFPLLDPALELPRQLLRQVLVQEHTLRGHSQRTHRGPW